MKRPRLKVNIISNLRINRFRKILFIVCFKEREREKKKDKYLFQIWFKLIIANSKKMFAIFRSHSFFFLLAHKQAQILILNYLQLERKRKQKVKILYNYIILIRNKSFFFHKIYATYNEVT